MRQIITVLAAALILIQGTVRAEVPLMSQAELGSHATHIVVGKVRAVYSKTHRSDNWEDTDRVAEIAVMNVEKGAGISAGDIVYAHYWNKKWIGTGVPDPHSAGHGGVSKGDIVRAYLDRKDGTYQVLLPNGFATPKSEEVKQAPQHATANLQGIWGFVYYEEQGMVEQTGTRQFVIAGNRLDFRQGGQTRIETTMELDAGGNPKQLTQKFKDGQVYRSIYVLAGDYLILCGNRDDGRPSEFACGTDKGGEFFIVLKRQR